jgi:glycosyltransferase involved in cell wall biosynthesis
MDVKRNAAPLVSVVVPVYNKADYLLDTIDSLLNQSYVHLEVIVVDDGSTDQSVEVLTHLRDDRLRVVRQQNRGVEAARNRGLEEASGAFIVFHDADDLSRQDRIERQVRYLVRHPEVSLVGSWAWVINSSSQPRSLKIPPISNSALRFITLFENFFVMSSVMIRRSLIEEIGTFREGRGSRFVEDYDFWSRALRRCGCANLPRFLVSYRVVVGSKTRSGGVTLGENARDISLNNIMALLPHKDSPSARELSLLVYGPACLISGKRISLWRASRNLISLWSEARSTGLIEFSESFYRLIIAIVRSVVRLGAVRIATGTLSFWQALRRRCRSL